MTKNFDGEVAAGIGIIGCGMFAFFCATAVLIGLVVLVWRLALGW